MPPERPPDEVWAHDALEARPSSIDGRGLYAREDLAAGTVVLRLGGRLVSTVDLAELIADAERRSAHDVDTITVHDDAHLVLPPGTLAHYANHSCEPSLWHLGAYVLTSRHDVRAGAELTVDYGTSSGAPGFAMACGCGATSCRGRVTSEDWRRPELQARYAGHWTPALQRRIDGRRARPDRHDGPMDPDAIRTLVEAYAAAWGAGDRAAWLATFATTATQEDPIGEGVRRGHDEIGAFWDRAMADRELLEIRPRAVHVAGGEAAMEWTIVSRRGDEWSSFDGVDAFTFTAGPLIATVRAYWDRTTTRTWTDPG